MTVAHKTTAFQVKADLFPLTILVLHAANAEAVELQLAELTRKAPNYFKNAPIVIDVSAVQDNLDQLPAVLAVLRTNQLCPVGIRGMSEEQQAQHACTDLPIFKSKGSDSTASSNKPKSNANTHSTRTITKPVRAGNKIYAKNADLIIVGPVNVGAEVIADGNIHIYGPLRGRALAGASGNTSARIFCQQLDPELIAIAGHYQVSENLQKPENNGQVIQVYLSDNTLIITHT